MPNFLTSWRTNVRRSLLVSAVALLVVAGGAYATTIGTSITTVGVAATGATVLTADAAATIPLSVVGAASQSGNFVNVTTNGGTAGDILKITSYGTGVWTPSRTTDAYSYGVDINSNTFFTGTAATKSYLLSVRGDRTASYAATGDSNDALVRVSGNNYGANDSDFIFRGINSGINNRSGGTLGILEGASIGAQAKSGGTVPTVRGMTVTAENYGTMATEFGGIDVVMKNEAAIATTEYGIRVRNLNNSLATAIGAGYLLSDTGVNVGYTYGLDMNGATIGTADIRLHAGSTITDTAGVVTIGATSTNFGGSMTIPKGAGVAASGVCAAVTDQGKLYYATTTANGMTSGLAYVCVSDANGDGTQTDYAWEALN
jgi:hypothetical protein